jgi:hypothetical protein
LGALDTLCLLGVGIARLIVAEMANIALDTSGTWPLKIASHMRSSAVNASVVDFSLFFVGVL